MSSASADLGDLVDGKNTYCLNEQAAHPHANVLVDNGACLKSADDEQLLMYFPFSEPVSLSAISIEAPSGESAPSLVKLYVNQPSMSFDDTDATATQVLELDEKDVAEGQLMELRFVKFQRVMGITIFVEENHGSDVTQINRIRIFGKRMNALASISEIKNCSS